MWCIPLFKVYVKKVDKDFQKQADTLIDRFCLSCLSSRYDIPNSTMEFPLSILARLYFIYDGVEDGSLSLERFVKDLTAIFILCSKFTCDHRIDMVNFIDVFQLFNIPLEEGLELERNMFLKLKHNLSTDFNFALSLLPKLDGFASILDVYIDYNRFKLFDKTLSGSALDTHIESLYTTIPDYRKNTVNSFLTLWHVLHLELDKIRRSPNEKKLELSLILLAIDMKLLFIEIETQSHNWTLEQFTKKKKVFANLIKQNKPGPMTERAFKNFIDLWEKGEEVEQLEEVDESSVWYFARM